MTSGQRQNLCGREFVQPFSVESPISITTFSVEVNFNKANFKGDANLIYSSFSETDYFSFARFASYMSFA
jgi:hypothetical protein